MAAKHQSALAQPQPWPLKGRHLLNKEARAYKAEVSGIIAMQMYEAAVAPMPGRVGVRLMACPPDRRKRDLDNIIKIVLDSCKGRCFEDDANIDHLEVLRGDVLPPGSIEVSVWMIDNGSGQKGWDVPKLTA